MTAEEGIELRARPRPVLRLRKSMVVLGAGGAVVLILGTALIALKPPRLKEATGTELYNVDHKPKPEVLDRLDKARREPPVQLGGPLPGDLGSAVVRTERQLGLDPAPYRADAEVNDARAARIQAARREVQAREAGVFFAIANRTRAGDTSAKELSDGVAVPPADKSGSFRNPHDLEPLTSPYTLLAGTVIAASLITGINSDLPGTVIAQVTEGVHDTVTGRHLLIPQGSRLIGRYDNRIAFGQERVFVIWQRLIRPDGSSLALNDLPAGDTRGQTGLADRVDNHTAKLLKGIMLSSLLGVGTELAARDAEDELLAAIRNSAWDTANRAGQRIVDRHLNVQPTLRIRPGWPVRVIVTQDLVLTPYDGDQP